MLVHPDIVGSTSVGDGALLGTLGRVLAVQFGNALGFGFMEAGFRSFCVPGFNAPLEGGGVCCLSLPQNLGNLFIDVRLGEHAALVLSFGPRRVFLTWTLGVPLRPVCSGRLGTSGFNR